MPAGAVGRRRRDISPAPSKPPMSPSEELQMYLATSMGPEPRRPPQRERSIAELKAAVEREAALCARDLQRFQDDESPREMLKALILEVSAHLETSALALADAAKILEHFS